MPTIVEEPEIEVKETEIREIIPTVEEAEPVDDDGNTV